MVEGGVIVVDIVGDEAGVVVVVVVVVGRGEWV